MVASFSEFRAGLEPGIGCSPDDRFCKLGSELVARLSDWTHLESGEVCGIYSEDLPPVAGWALLGLGLLTTRGVGPAPGISRWPGLLDELGGG